MTAYKRKGQIMKNFLIVVDMQKDFVDGALGTKDTAEGKKLPVPHCIKGTACWELDKIVAKALEGKSYATIEKLTFGAVDLPALVRTIAKNEDFSLELIGLCTDICVVSNALILKAAFPEAEISVDTNCCAGVTVDSHKAALLTMKFCQIDIKE